MSNHANLGTVTDVEAQNTAGPSGLNDDQTSSLFDQEPRGIMEEILCEADSLKDYAMARQKVFEVIEEGGLHAHREVLFQMVDELEAGHKGSALEKGKNHDPGE